MFQTNGCIKIQKLKHWVKLQPSVRANLAAKTCIGAIKRSNFINTGTINPGKSPIFGLIYAHYPHKCRKRY